ncbi:MAG: hypothetical protein ACYS1E_20680, partial [Planctomycetota bacterium]
MLHAHRVGEGHEDALGDFVEGEHRDHRLGDLPDCDAVGGAVAIEETIHQRLHAAADRVEEQDRHEEQNHLGGALPHAEAAHQRVRGCDHEGKGQGDPQRGGSVGGRGLRHVADVEELPADDPVAHCHGEDEDPEKRQVVRQRRLQDQLHRKDHEHGHQAHQRAQEHDVRRVLEGPAAVAAALDAQHHDRTDEERQRKDESRPRTQAGRQTERTFQQTRQDQQESGGVGEELYAPVAHHPGGLEGIGREEVEDRGAHQRRVDRHAAPRPEDRIDVDRVAELHRHRRAEEQQRPGPGAVRPQPPDGTACDQVDRGHDGQHHVEEHRERRPSLGRRDRGDANRQAGAIALPEQIGGRNALAQVGQR